MRSVGGGGYRVCSDEKNSYVTDRASRADVRTPLQRSSLVGNSQSRGRSLGRARRGYPGSSNGDGGYTRRDNFIPTRFAGESQNGSVKKSRYVSGRGDEVGLERVSQRCRQVWGLCQDWNGEGDHDSYKNVRPFVIKSSHIPSIGDRGWIRNPPVTATVALVRTLGWDQVERGLTGAFHAILTAFRVMVD